jgi:hypothetical protein
MTSLFYPRLFDARGGFVCWNGRAISDLTADRVAKTLLRAGLAAPYQSRLFGIMHEMHGQIRAAQVQACEQRRRRAA